MDEQPDHASDLWVFAYGSLMWKPGFDFVERKSACLNGYRRGFCMWSIHHRGSVEKPGLVLALDPVEDASCEGIALRVAPDARTTVLEYLRARELISSAYIERFETIQLEDGRSVEAVAYVMDRSHEQYTGALTLEHQAEVIARSVGGMGPNDEYLYSTLEHLNQMGCPDPEMEEIARLVRMKSAG